MNKLHHGGDIYSYGASVLDFSANINPLGVPAGVEQAIINSIDSCVHYPDPLNRALTAKLAEHEDVPPDCIQWGNGAADLIYRIAYGLRPKRALLLAPTFSEYELALSNVGCEIRYYFLKEENHFQVQEDILSQLAAVDMVFICNPNNPTGLLTALSLLEKILDRCEKSDTILVMDECFNEFLDCPETYTMKSYLGERKNLIILKAFTKIYAIPGVRLGYAFCSPAIGEDIYKAGQAWPVSVLAANAGIAALDEADYVANSRKLVGEQRQYLTQELKRLNLKVYPGQANYLFFQSSCHDLKARLLYHNILIRDCSNYIGLAKGSYRIAVKSSHENKVFIGAIKKVLDTQ